MSSLDLCYLVFFRPFRYPDAFDAAVEQTLTEFSSQAEALDILQEMMSLTKSPIRHQVMTSDSSTSLMLGLNHSQVSQRVLAVRQVASYIQQNKRVSCHFVLFLKLTREKRHPSERKQDVGLTG